MSIVAAFFVVFRNATTPGCIAEETQSQRSGAAKKDETMKARRQFRSEGANFNGLSYTERKLLDDTVTNPWRSLPGLSAGAGALHKILAIV
ncbi:unnamed protein product [Parnassius apollo]|uniref:(apollo) hypothetical protein n=1 Tax=Parnassius apollo TaxID=110799 RepID=A0A8S3X6Q1_PARAO|nr:unnamed protein product [Parnassius apollo]